MAARALPRARLVETYTSTEVGPIAQPCPGGGRLHVAEDGVLCECLGADAPPTDGVGELAVTDLTN